MFDNELINFVLFGVFGLVRLDEFGFDIPIDTNVKVFVINFEDLKIAKSCFVRKIITYKKWVSNTAIGDLCLVLLWVQIILVEYQPFWIGSIRFGRVQIIKISPEKSSLNLTKMIWTRPKQFGRSKIKILFFKPERMCICYKIKQVF